MQFAHFGLKLALNQTRNQDDQETGMDPVYFLKLPVLNDKIEDHNQIHNIMSQVGGGCEGNIRAVRLDENDNSSVQLHFTGGEEEGDRKNKNDLTKELKSKKKRTRTRTSKTSEEVESQRTTYIAVQLLQCLESQKRQIILGETGNRQIGNMTTTMTSSSSITSVANPLIISGNLTELDVIVVVMFQFEVKFPLIISGLATEVIDEEGPCRICIILKNMSFSHKATKFVLYSKLSYLPSKL
ncbi:hypothetical protein Bca4012_087123 [Brassica carinata]|uniref:Uncharacterized protein n=1 Tax=Brassica carinata TaxID=52824 RepID=A0A8X7TPV8_BRACI|nr:hypothetical protein Bca52824_089167 [Brassica carinata]